MGDRFQPGMVIGIIPESWPLSARNRDRLGPDSPDWTVSREEIEARNFNLKAVNPHAMSDEDTRTPEELLDLIEAKGREVAEALAVLRGSLEKASKERI